MADAGTRRHEGDVERSDSGTDLQSHAMDGGRDVDVGRNSPTSPVRFRHLELDPSHADDRLPSHPGPGTEDEDDADSTPRSEVPSTVSQSPYFEGRDNTSGPSSDAGGDAGYFLQRPIRYFAPNIDAPSTSIDTAPSSLRDRYDVRQRLDMPERPNFGRDHLSSTSTASNATIRAMRYDRPTSELTTKRSRENPHVPDQSFSVLPSQQGIPPPMRGLYHTHTSKSSNSVLTLSNRERHDRATDIGAKTVGNTPAGSPGLFSPASPSQRYAFEAGEEEGFYSSPYLHFTHRQAPKETHVADVDVDPVTGRKLINQYEVIDELGRGVHGKVKLGRNVETGQYVAIKIVERYSKRRRLGKIGSHEDKIKKEIAILKKARHPNIVGLLEVIDDPTRKKVYIVLEHVEMGEVRWRTEGTDEVVLVDYRRHQRESAGVFENDAAAMKDEKIMREAARHRERTARLDARRRRERGAEHISSWSFEHGGDTESEESGSEGPDQVFATAVNDRRERRIARRGTESAGRGEPTELESDRTIEARPPSSPSRADSPQHKRKDEPDLLQADLEGTMYGAYMPEISRARTSSSGGSHHSRSPEPLDIHDVPENFRYVPLMTLPGARAVFRDTVLGLEYLHYQGVIHRDIKPANLLQAKDHHVKISDFGVSYLGTPTAALGGEDQSESEAPDADGAVELAKTVGTPAFYAPELCQTDCDAEPPPVTGQIDVWSLGVTLYCLVFGRVPFRDTNTFAIMHEIAEEEVYVPRMRLKAVEEGSGSRPNSRNRTYAPINSNKRAPHELVYEEIDNDLLDLFSKLFVKDPRHRITLQDVKEHPWILRDIVDPLAWLDETDPSKQTHGQKIKVSKEDVADAVVPYHLVMERVRAGLRRLGGGISGALGMGKGSGSRKRAKSSAAMDDGHSSSAHSSSSTISQDARRASVRVDESIYSALRASREGEHPLSHSVTASPDMSEHNPFFAGTSSSSSRANSPIAPSTAHDRFAAARPTPERMPSGMSTATSSRTIRPADLSRTSRHPPHVMTGMPITPSALDSPTGSGLGGIFGGAGRRIMRSVRSRERSLGKARSNDRLGGYDDDAHGEPSVAFCNTTAAGEVDLPAGLQDASPLNSARQSPVSARARSTGSPDHLHLHPRHPSADLSRHSPLWSTSSAQDFTGRPPEGYLPPPRSVASSTSSLDSTDERSGRATRGPTRRPASEEPQNRWLPLSSPIYPPVGARNEGRRSPLLGRDTLPPTLHEEDDTLQTQILDRAPSAEPSPPTSRMSVASTKPITSSSSEDQLYSGISQSTSHPSIPSIPSTMSANSSIVTDASLIASLTDDNSKDGSTPSDDTVNPAVIISAAHSPEPSEDARPSPFDSFTAGGLEGDHAVESCADDEDNGSDSDSDSEGCMMEMRRRGAKSPGAAASPITRHRPRHGRPGTSSVRSTRSGSNGTVKKVRSPDRATEDDDDEDIRRSSAVSSG